MSDKYKFHNPDGVYFITSTITNRVDVFTKPAYCGIIIDSLKYCQENKGLVVHAWVIMTNHLHLIVSRNAKPLLSEILRDFKRFTSIELIKTIHANDESRKVWMLALFKEAAAHLKRVDNFKVWQDGNHPIELDSNTMIEQKLNYLHDNPVTAGFVFNPEDYTYSSAIDYAGGKGLLDLEILGVMDKIEAEFD